MRWFPTSLSITLALLVALSFPAHGAADAEQRESEELEAFHALEESALARGQDEALLRTLQAMNPASPLRRSLAPALGLEVGQWVLPGHLSAVGGLPSPLPFPLSAVEGKYDIPMALNDQVAEYLAFFQGPGRRWFARWLERSHRWMPLFRDILRDHELPEDLVFLAMIESGFSMHATSRAAAVGPWQFMPATGKEYGLRVDFWVDERRDFEKSTHAAARFLRWLHGQWDDWYLAWAGYNAGPGRVRRAIASHEVEDFWELSAAEGAFRKETRHYVPKLLAAALIAKHPEHFGFDSLEPMPPLDWEIVEIADATDIEVIARCAGVDVSLLRDLNPELRQWATPPVLRGDKPYALRLPKGKAEGFAEAFAKVAPSQRFTFRSYKVQKGDTPGHIARMFNTSTEELMRSNRIQNARSLRVGQELLIPIPPGALPPQASRSGPARPAQPDTAAGNRHHTLRKGETLSHLAEHYGTTVEALRTWNDIRDVRKLQAGQRLRIR